MLAATRCLPGRGPRMLECGRALADGTHSAAGAQRACTGKTSTPQKRLAASQPTRGIHTTPPLMR